MTLLLIKDKITGPGGPDGIKNEWHGFRSQWIYTIGLAGLDGFGLGCCPPELLPDGFAPLSTGTTDPNRTHPHFGNYIHLPSASIMCYIPKHYMRLNIPPTTLEPPYYGVRVIITHNKGNGTIPRCMRDNNKDLAGFFLDKYQISNGRSDGSGRQNIGSDGIPDEGGIAVSRPLHWPCSAKANPRTVGAPIVDSVFSNLSSTALNSGHTTPADLPSAVWHVCASRGDTFFPVPTWTRAHLAYLSLAHSQALLGEDGNPISGAITKAAWMDTEPYAPKGNNQGREDINKPSLQFTHDGIAGATEGGHAGKAYRAFTGAGYTSSTNGRVAAVEQTTHNGQPSGVADVNGNQWDIAPGLTTATGGTVTASSYRLYSETKAWSAVGNVNDILNSQGLVQLAANTTDNGIWWISPDALWGHLVPSSNGTWHTTNSFTGSNASQTTRKAMTDCLIPRQGGTDVGEAGQSDSTNLFGGDGFRHRTTNGTMPLFGGMWARTYSAGICCLSLAVGYGTQQDAAGTRAVHLVATS